MVRASTSLSVTKAVLMLAQRFDSAQRDKYGAKG